MDVCKYLAVWRINNRPPSLELPEITIGVHRGQIMRKLNAGSLAELVRTADTLGITSHKSARRIVHCRKNARDIKARSSIRQIAVTGRRDIRMAGHKLEFDLEQKTKVSYRGNLQRQ